SGKTIKNYDGNTSYGINEIAENVSGLANGVYFIKLRAERKDRKEDIVIKNIQTVAGKLVEGKKWTEKEVGMGIKDIGSAISKLRKTIEP
ncbi:MAG: hypothetical protein ABIN58_01040, partial [candidate division WOR-3 bacterium]